MFCRGDGSFCFQSSRILLPLIPDLTNPTEQETFSSMFKFILLFVNIFVKLPVVIIAFLNSPLTKDIEMNDIANLDEIEQTTNKSQ